MNPLQTLFGTFRNHSRHSRRLGLALFGTVCIGAAAPLYAAPAGPKGKGDGQAKGGEAPKPGIQTFAGTLKTGVMAIGAETTGYTLTTPTDGVYELEFKNPKLKAQADALDGKQISVEGLYKPRPGVEVKERRIIEVKRLAGAGAN